MYAAYAYAAMPTSAIPEIIPTSMAVSSIITTAVTSHEVPMTPAAAMVPNLTTYYDNNVLCIITLPYTGTRNNLITANTQW